MAPLPVIAGVHRCAIHYQAADGPYAVNVIHLGETGAAVTAADVGAKIVASWPNHMMTAIPNTVAADYIDVTPLDGFSPTVRTVTGSAGEFVGEQTGNYLPAVCTLVKITTDNRGRSNRGRVFRPFTAEETATNGFLDGANVALLKTAWDTFNAALKAGSHTLELVVASYKLASANPAITLTAESALATQRRRQSRLR